MKIRADLSALSGIAAGAALLTLAASCNRAVARPSGVTAALDLQGDTAVLIRASWRPPSTGTPPFTYYVRAGATRAGGWTFRDTTAALADSAFVVLADTAQASSWCVAAGNAAGTGPEACTAFIVPARVELPGAPDSLEIQVDTASVPLARVTGIKRWDGAYAVAAYLGPMAGAELFTLRVGPNVVDHRPATLYPPCFPAAVIQTDLFLADSVTYGCDDGRTEVWIGGDPQDLTRPGLPKDSLPCGAMWATGPEDRICRYDVAPYYLLVWTVPAATRETVGATVLDSAGRAIGRLALAVGTP
jgi:hypothetical protein